MCQDTDSHVVHFTHGDCNYSWVPVWESWYVCFFFLLEEERDVRNRSDASNGGKNYKKKRKRYGIT